MGAWEDDLAKKQADNERKTGKKNYSAPYDASKIRPAGATPSPAPTDQATGNINVDLTNAMERRKAKLRGIE